MMSVCQESCQEKSWNCLLFKSWIKMIDAEDADEVFSNVVQFDGDNEEENNNFVKLILVVTSSTFKRNLLKFNFPWMYIHDWQSDKSFKWNITNPNARCAKNDTPRKPMHQAGSTTWNWCSKSKVAKHVPSNLDQMLDAIHNWQTCDLKTCITEVWECHPRLHHQRWCDPAQFWRRAI